MIILYSLVDLKIDLNSLNDVKQEEHDNQIWGVEQNIKDELWIGNNNSVIQYDIENNSTLTHIFSRKPRPIFWTILRSQEGRWWAGGFKKELYISNFPQNDSLFLFKKYNEFEEFKEARVNHLLEEGEYIWVSTTLGLYLIHKEKGVVKQYNAEAPENFRLPVVPVHLLYKDAAKCLLVGFQFRRFDTVQR